MTKQEKLRSKFLTTPPPKDFKFDDLVTMLSGIGFQMFEPAGGSSHKHFVLALDDGQELRLNVVKPHPQNILKTYQIKQIANQLKEWRLL